MDRDFRRGSASPTAVAQGPAKNLGLSRVIGAPGPEDLAKINRKLEELVEIMWESHAGGELICLSWVIAPIVAGGGGDED
jgi:hypothetical protein